jgi:hypothetical protein
MIVGHIIGGKKLELDLPKLVDTRLLIQANSGGGKSWLLRLIAESAGIQTIVLDNEGEFASLREAVDVLLVGADGELPANPRHAALLARRLLEYKVSAVIDLYELKAFRSAPLRKAISRIAHSFATRSLAADFGDP